MQKKTKTTLGKCERCGLDILPDEPNIQYTLYGKTHSPGRCVFWLQEEINKLKSKRNVKQL